ncbi:Lecithin:cholesterol acyltransferase family protein [Trichomonas vaginalis G3]|uniref:Lecithin:cholesterol acyltransferase family protein n=1 Tax=Trichomonas vaginalis (strain ATCC PRA-98 / G3) TaxID=412133 RepID=A2FX85_TRIV3|nr:O-acyltransferase protein [Trichomonas vaginalis G3]EAX90498.1 Lecithin:cholesterol acyltransferase family protein [Trichomonas vaginalis G3]KAI5538668.1 O-acyltransferase protein [Trichomonas vaginalis G3]|eukprot:XP_001303428.1 Lecithin:cholesterol acyltransferase family protein [Trichomonas vaginalis G3]
MGSVLRGSVTNRKTHWYCPKNVAETDIWVKKQYCIPPLGNCLSDWLTMRYDNTTKSAINQEGVNLDIVDFGGVDGISYLDEFFNITNFIPYFNKYIKYLETKGYTVGKDLFGAPFDWRRGLMLGDDHYKRMKDLVEKAYTLNSNQKVALVGHSLGGYFIHYFLSNVTIPEWRQKYIESAILVAPSFGGCGTVVENLWNGALYIMRHFGISESAMGSLASSLGALYVHLPNHKVFGQLHVFHDETGKGYTAAELPELLAKNGKFRNTPEIFELHKKFSAQTINPLDVPTVIVYNDKMKTVIGYNAQTKEYMYSLGDTLINAEGYHYACNNWKSSKKLKCINLDSTSELASHIFMVMKEEYVDLVLKHVLDTEWEK